jgi:hypothetical protein
LPVSAYSDDEDRACSLNEVVDDDAEFVDFRDLFDLG